MKRSLNTYFINFISAYFYIMINSFSDQQTTITDGSPKIALNVGIIFWHSGKSNYFGQQAALM